MISMANWWKPIPDPGDPPDIGVWLIERIKDDERAKIVQAQLGFQRKVLAAQLELLDVVQEVSSKYMG